MKEEALIALYERHNIDWQNLAPKEAKRWVLIAELDEQAKRNNLSPQPTLEPMLRQLRENRADEADMNSMLEVVLYARSNRALDPAPKKRKPENKFVLFGQMARVMESDNLGARRAAKKIQVDWSPHYPGGHKQIAVRLHQIKAEIRKLEASRFASRFDRFDQLVTKYGDDVEAVNLLGVYAHHCIHLMHAYECGDVEQIAESNAMLDSILEVDHPITVELMLLHATAEDVYRLLETKLPRLRDDSYRKELLAAHGLDDVGADKAVRRLLDFLQRFGLVE